MANETEFEGVDDLDTGVNDVADDVVDDADPADDVDADTFDDVDDVTADASADDVQDEPAETTAKPSPAPKSDKAQYSEADFIEFSKNERGRAMLEEYRRGAIADYERSAGRAKQSAPEPKPAVKSSHDRIQEIAAKYEAVKVAAPVALQLAKNQVEQEDAYEARIKDAYASAKRDVLETLAPDVDALSQFRAEQTMVGARNKMKSEYGLEPADYTAHLAAVRNTYLNGSDAEHVDLMHEVAAARALKAKLANKADKEREATVVAAQKNRVGDVRRNGVATTNKVSILDRDYNPKVDGPDVLKFYQRKQAASDRQAAKKKSA